MINGYNVDVVQVKFRCSLNGVKIKLTSIKVEVEAEAELGKNSLKF